MTAYFSSADFASLSVPHSQAVVTDKMHELHRALTRRVRDHGWDIHSFGQVLVGKSATGRICAGLTSAFTRSHEQATLVERLMGRDANSHGYQMDVTRHPVIELRLLQEGLALELIVPPNAWWDQRNVVGKIAVTRHRDSLREIMRRSPQDMHCGFWEGVLHSDAYLTTAQLLYKSNLDEWMGTFSDGQDWLRIGTWYAPDDVTLHSDAIVRELTQRLAALVKLYQFFLWTGNNNFHSFYPGAGSATRDVWSSDSHWV
jgi:hypothetical protein